MKKEQPAQRSISIIGLGYVGLPLAIQFARNGVEVLGVDIDLHELFRACRRSAVCRLHPAAAGAQRGLRRHDDHFLHTDEPVESAALSHARPVHTRETDDLGDAAAGRLGIDDDRYLAGPADAARAILSAGICDAIRRIG